MIDTNGGQARIRAWPRSRGAPKSQAQLAAQEQFRAWQWASKYLSPEMYRQITEARVGTPILPRDFITCMLSGRLAAFRLTDGKVLYPVTARNDVSSGLDMLSQTPGDTLVRGEEFWEGRGATPVGGLALLQETVVSTPVSSVVSPPLAGISLLVCVGTGVTTSNSVQRAVQLSNTNGVSWLTTLCNYVTLDADGVPSNQSAIYPHATLATAARAFIAVIYGLSSTASPAYLESTRGRTGYLPSTITGVNRARFVPLLTGSITGTFTAGRFKFFGL